MDTENLWDALTLFTFGAVLGLIGMYLRKEYRRLFVGPNRIVEPVGAGTPFAAYLGYISSFLFTASILFFVSSAYSLVSELWRTFRR